MLLVGSRLSLSVLDGKNAVNETYAARRARELVSGFTHINVKAENHPIIAYSI